MEEKKSPRKKQGRPINDVKLVGVVPTYAEKLILEIYIMRANT